MKIALLGTGTVGRTLADKLNALGHDVTIGTRDVEQTLARTEPDWFGNPPYAEWQKTHSTVQLRSFADAAAYGEVVINATTGAISLEALEAAGADNLASKVLIDVALPLDLSEGMPPTLTVANTDSLAEQIQRAYPDARVVKTLTTVAAAVMVDPGRVPGRHNIFVAGNDAEAKATVAGLLRELGWAEDVILDLGDLRGARGAEMYSRLYFQLASSLGFDINIAVTKEGLNL